VYLKECKGTIILLLNGRNKSSQQMDIETAKELWSNYKDELEDGN
jgi:putative component of toxin-antitoxin plasmid stabilization module